MSSCSALCKRPGHLCSAHVQCERQDRPVQMKISVQIEHVIGMNLVISGSAASGPVIVHGYDMDRFPPMNQVIGHIEIPVCTDPANIVFAVVFHYAGIRHSRKYRILDVLRKQSAATGKSEW